MTQLKRGNLFALLALVVAAISLLVISCGPLIYNSIYPPLAPKPVIGQIIEGVKDAVSGTPTSAAGTRDGVQYIRASGLILAVVAIILSAVASLRNEHRRITQVAFGLAAATVVCYHFLLVIVVLAILLLITFVLGAMT